jgi:hypothetical protein
MVETKGAKVLRVPGITVYSSTGKSAKPKIAIKANGVTVTTGTRALSSFAATQTGQALQRQYGALNPKFTFSGKLAKNQQVKMYKEYQSALKEYRKFQFGQPVDVSATVGGVTLHQTLNAPQPYPQP